MKIALAEAEFVAFTSDGWTNNHHAYLSLTCHYINMRFEFRSCMLGLQYCPQSHSSAYLAENIDEMICVKWGLRNKGTTVTIDGAANGQAALDKIPYLEKIYCINHILHLVVKG